MVNAWVFPGQGSQKLGMADDLVKHPLGRERFALASQKLGRDLAAICAGTAEGDLSDLNDTRNTQPALFVVESLLIDLLGQQQREAALLAGHSLGELVALYAGGVFDASTGIDLVIRRSQLMAAAGGGAMTAVMGFQRPELEQAVADTEGVVIANDNSEAQVVLSGQPEAVAQVVEAITCKRAVPLAVSGAFHSPFMAEPAAAFAQQLDAVVFSDSQVPVLSNTDPTPCTDGTQLKQRLREQMTTGVRWRETMEALGQAGVETCIEVGPGAVLSGLIKRSLAGVVTAQVNNISSLGLN
ncbi:MAG: [acyl-carrier-protein] S-malonyltransferase [Synechococcus sp. TMED19]|nr:MAG: [acyl-carrier-protein] S-malonyltransferase [Synechococcus sp. TMED19]